MTIAWIDATAGVAGDMLLGALIDAGAPVSGIQDALDEALPGALRITTEEVARGAVRACHARVLQIGERSVDRTWPAIRDLLQRAPLDELTRRRALAVFERLARAEAHVHGADLETVHFHEVGGLDAIGDIVGVCEALRLLDVDHLSASWVAVGNGRIHAAHGLMPVPAPAVLELSRGWEIRSVPGALRPSDLHHHHHDHDAHHDHEDHAHLRTRSPSDADRHRHEEPGHDHEHDHHGVEEPPALPGDPRDIGELATPTGMALVRALCDSSAGVPEIRPRCVGTGAGARDIPGWANCVRVIVGEPPHDPAAGSRDRDEMVELRANLDDIDHRLVPGVIDACLDAGAVDAWVTPIQMKKGRPAIMIQALAPRSRRGEVAELLLSTTPTLGVRESPVTRTVLERDITRLEVNGRPVTIKIGHRDGRVLHAQAEFESLARLARDLGLTELDAAQRAAAAIVEAGLVAGAPYPTLGAGVD